jgi:hypothetical protein
MGELQRFDREGDTGMFRSPCTAIRRWPRITCPLSHLVSVFPASLRLVHHLLSFFIVPSAVVAAQVKNKGSDNPFNVSDARKYDVGWNYFKLASRQQLGGGSQVS